MTRAGRAFGAPMAYFFKVLRTEVARQCDRMGLGRVGEVSDLVDGDAVALAEPDRESTVPGESRPAAGYDKAQVRERVWRRVSPEDAPPCGRWDPLRTGRRTGS